MMVTIIRYTLNTVNILNIQMTKFTRTWKYPTLFWNIKKSVLWPSQYLKVLCKMRYDQVFRFFFSGTVAADHADIWQNVFT